MISTFTCYYVITLEAIEQVKLIRHIACCPRNHSTFPLAVYYLKLD